MAAASIVSARLTSVARRTAAAAFGRVVLPAAAAGSRSVTGIKILNERETAFETDYHNMEEDRLLKKMIENDPALSPELQDISNIIRDGGSTEDKVKMIVIKHGIPPVNKRLISDIVMLAEQSK
eukprot:TRINITY_DN37691_c0_g1_i1.p1 TRINITY_DN37691_c0_g1~~TRINITY_DN37691_c0_g1_i1.p1  ORF type:complete len:124 (-),score=40.71 TRINITY_DN37691_c0_g1_i1:234-605(-)